MSSSYVRVFLVCAYAHTLDVVVLVLVLGDLECWPVLAFGWGGHEQVIDELIVDFSKGNKDGKLLVLKPLEVQW